MDQSEFQEICEQPRDGDDVLVQIPKRRLDKLIGHFNTLDPGRSPAAARAVVYLMAESTAQAHGADHVGGEDRVAELAREVDSLPWASPRDKS